MPDPIDIDRTVEVARSQGHRPVRWHVCAADEAAFLESWRVGDHPWKKCRDGVSMLELRHAEYGNAIMAEVYAMPERRSPDHAG